jgi:hypothetical protein
MPSNIKQASRKFDCSIGWEGNEAIAKKYSYRSGCGIERGEYVRPCSIQKKFDPADRRKGLLGQFSRRGDTAF